MSGFFTVKETAEKLGVSLQTIYNHIKTLDENLVKKENRVTLISLEGVEEIKERLGNNEEEQAGSNEIYIDYIETLKQQIEAKDKQIEQLLERQKELNTISYQGALNNAHKEEKALVGNVKASKEKIEDMRFMERLKFLFTGKID